MHHDFSQRRPLGMASHFEADNGDIVFAAVDFDKLKMARRLGELFGPVERAVADHHDPIRTAAFEKSVGEKNCVLYSSGCIRGFKISAQLAQPALVGAKRHEQARLRTRTDDHHFLFRRESVHQRQKFPPRRVEARAAFAFGFHAGA